MVGSIAPVEPLLFSKVANFGKIKKSMFGRVALSFGTGSLQIFVSQDPFDVFATVADLAVALELQPATVRSELSGSLVKLPELTNWISANEPFQGEERDAFITPLSASNKTYYFAPSAAWKSLVKNRVSSDVWSSIKHGIQEVRHQRGGEGEGT